MYEDIKETDALQELRGLLRPQLGDETDLAVEGLVRYMAIVLRIFEAIEADPGRLARLDALTSGAADLTIAAERSFTNQYSEP